QSVRATRQSIWDLRVSPLKPPEVADMLLALGRELTEGTSAAFDLSINGESRACSVSTTTELARISREAISNAVRHGRAHNIRVELVYSVTSLLLRVVDDGVGFDAVRNMQVGDHYGLAVMRERVTKLRGQFRLDTSLDSGTVVEVQIPLPS